MHEGHTRDVEQVYLRCSQGSLEWLYPTGAVIVNLRPNTVSPAAARLSVCIKPSADSRGTNIYLDRNGKLRLLLREQDQARGRVQCFGISEGALFIEAIPHMDISRRTTAFQYELLSNRPGADALSLGGKMNLCCHHFSGLKRLMQNEATFGPLWWRGLCVKCSIYWRISNRWNQSLRVEPTKFVFVKEDIFLSCHTFPCEQKTYIDAFFLRVKD